MATFFAVAISGVVIMALLVFMILVVLVTLWVVCCITPRYHKRKQKVLLNAHNIMQEW